MVGDILRLKRDALASANLQNLVLLNEVIPKHWSKGHLLPGHTERETQNMIKNCDSGD